MSTSEPAPKGPGAVPPTIPTLFFRFFSLGIKSFGGGVATFALIHNTVVICEGWVSEEEFVREWAMVQLAPGINLLGLVILIGRRVRGLSGICACLVGLMLPSCLITVLISATYTHLRGSSTVQAALSGALPAIVSIGLLTCIQMARPFFQANPNRVPPQQIFDRTFCAILIVVSAVLAAAGRVPIPIILILLGGTSALVSVWQAHNRARGIAS